MMRINAVRADATFKQCQAKTGPIYIVIGTPLSAPVKGLNVNFKNNMQQLNLGNETISNPKVINANEN